MAEKSAVLSPEALDFAPGLLSIQESPPQKLPRRVIQMVTVLVTGLLVWAVLGKLDIIASAEGKLVPQTYVKIVQPADAGIVQEILVKEGESVKAGQVLMRMDMKVAEADRKSLESELTLKRLQLRRIAAELAGSPLTPETGVPVDLYSKVEAQYRDRRQSYEDNLEGAKEALNKARRDYDSGRQVLEKLREVTPILKEQAESYREMGKQGFAPQVAVRDKEREYVEKSRDLAAQEATLESLAAAIAQSERQVSQITSKYRSDLQNERVDAEGQYRKLQQEFAKEEHKSGLLELRASQAGVVKDLATHTVGTVVSPGTVLLSVVPENEPLVAEVMVKNDDVGFVYAQQQVKVKLAPYPFEKYGMLDGEVLRIGPDATDADANTNTPNKEAGRDKPAAMLYKAVISLKSQSLEAQGERFRLVPGMQVVAEINQGRRTVMEYLLSPVQKSIYESGRER
jgi:hemolysin D